MTSEEVKSADRGTASVRISDLDVVPSGEGRRQSLILRLSDDSGRIGLAETRIPDRSGALFDALDRMRSTLLGLDPAEHPRIVQRLLDEVRGRPGTTLAKAISLVEIACCDLATQTLGMAMSRLLGGSVRDRVKTCATDWEPANWTTETLAEASSDLVGRGFRALRFIPFPVEINEPSHSEIVRATRVCEAVRAAVGTDVGLWIDFGGRFSAVDAGRVARSFERVEPAGIIEPVAPTHWNRLSSLAARTRLPIGIGEGIHDGHDVRERIGIRGVDSLHLDPSEIGGLAVFRSIAGLADVFGIDFMISSKAAGISNAVALQLAAFVPSIRHVELAVSAMEQGPLEATILFDGEITIPSGLGLGLSAAVVDSYRKIPHRRS
jgi:galactonate dehydratase